DVHEALPGRDVGVSRPGEFHPQPLAEPDVSLSTHPAPIIQPWVQLRAPNGQMRVGKPQPADPVPSPSAACGGPGTCTCVGATAPDKRLRVSRPHPSPTRKIVRNSSSSHAGLG